MAFTHRRWTSKHTGSTTRIQEHRTNSISPGGTRFPWREKEENRQKHGERVENNPRKIPYLKLSNGTSSFSPNIPPPPALKCARSPRSLSEMRSMQCERVELLQLHHLRHPGEQENSYWETNNYTTNYDYSIPIMLIFTVLSTVMIEIQ